tara:strand:+ start:4108 stop:4281 length:174 start_codon:yes stop_codon:yes gene_type:complete
MNILNQNVVIPEFVLQILEEKFPNKLPEYQINEKELAHLLGQRSVINYLKSLNEIEE